MKKKTLIITTILFTLMTFTGLSFARNCGKWANQGNGAGPHYMQGPGPQWAALTPDQQTRLTALHQKFLDESADQRAAMIAKQEEIRILMGTTSPDQERLMKLTRELGRIKTDLMAKGITLALEAKKIAPKLNCYGLFHRWGMERFHKNRPGQRGWNFPANCPRTGPVQATPGPAPVQPAPAEAE